MFLHALAGTITHVPGVPVVAQICTELVTHGPAYAGACAAAAFLPPAHKRAPRPVAPSLATIWLMMVGSLKLMDAENDVYQ